MKLSDYVIDFLVSQKVTHVFEVCGGALAHLLDSLYGREDISTVSMHHEMAAAIAAEGYSRVGDSIGVAMATSGPGATNMVTGIGSCFFDSIPSLFITGQVNTYEFKFDRPVRQVGFQETDIVSIIKPITKKATLLKDADTVKYHLEEAFSLANQGRPGPILLDIPLNIQRADIDPKSLQSYHGTSSGLSGNLDAAVMDEIAQAIGLSTRPIILAGGGVRLSKAHWELQEFVHRTGIPVVTSLMGLDAFPHDDPMFIGMIGTYGHRYANLAIANSDLVIALGTRLDTRQTGTRPETFARGAKLIQVDIDPNELGNKVRVAFTVNSDIMMFLAQLNDFDLNSCRERIETWRKRIIEYKSRFPVYRVPSGEMIAPNYFMHELSKFLPEDAIVCVDVGQVQMWSAQALEIRGSQRFLTQGGMASMGCALPMAIGASFAKPGKVVVVIAGDGGFQLNIQELQTVYHHNLPIKIIVINNRCYGMVRQFQEQYFNSRFQSTVKGYSCPNFLEVARAYKIPSAKITASSQIAEALGRLFCDMSPRLLEINISESSKVLPKLSVNRPVEDQEPLLSRDELRSNMIIEILREPEEL